MKNFHIGDRVEGGDIEQDFDTGTIAKICYDDNRVLVAWDSLVMVWHNADELRAEGELEYSQLIS